MVLFLLHVPIGIALAVSSTITLMLTSDFNLYMVANKMFYSLESMSLMAVPGFVFAGSIMAQGGISKYLIAALKTWIGHFRGGLAMVTVLACMIFAAISGSSPATAAAIGSILIPAMVNAGYDRGYAMGLVAAAGTLGILIPPSICFVLFAITTETSVGKLFAAGIIPGITLGSILLLTALIIARLKGYGGEEKEASWDERWRSTIKALPSMFLPVLILGSIYAGIATPTEASVISIFYALFISVFYYRELNWEKFKVAVRDGLGTTSMIFLIIAAAHIFALFLADQQIAQAAIKWTVGTGISLVAFWIFVQLLFFVLGTFLEAASIILITLPILAPLAIKMGIDIYHFAVVMVVNMELAMITPPVGLNLFVVSTVGKSSLGKVVRGVAPFLVVMIFVLILLVIFPQISLWLPTKMGM